MKRARKSKLFKATPSRARFVSDKMNSAKKSSAKKSKGLLNNRLKGSAQSKESGEFLHEHLQTNFCQENHSPNSSSGKRLCHKKNVSSALDAHDHSACAAAKLPLMKSERHLEVSLEDLDDEQHSSPLHFAIMENDVSGAVLRATHAEDTQAVK